VPPLTPRRIQATGLPGAVRGYDRAATDRLLQKVADDYEALWLERKELRERVERLEAEIAQLNERERHVAEALLAAERTANAVRTDAQRDAEALVADARAERMHLEAAISHLRGLVERVQSDLSAFLTDTLEQLRSRGAADAAQTGSGEGAPSLVDDLATVRRTAAE
jgi:cell division septum initiation protein DivIVA